MDKKDLAAIDREAFAFATEHKQRTNCSSQYASGVRTGYAEGAANERLCAAPLADVLEWISENSYDAIKYAAASALDNYRARLEKK